MMQIQMMVAIAQAVVDEQRARVRSKARSQFGAISSDFVIVTGGVAVVALGVMAIFGDKVLSKLNSISF